MGIGFYIVVGCASVIVFFIVFSTIKHDLDKSAPERLRKNIIKAEQKKEMYEMKQRHKAELTRGSR
jgi:hypothetical protein